MPSRVLLCDIPSYSSFVVRGFDEQLQSVELPSSATRRLRPAGQRPASRRLSRSPSAPERTINVLHRRRWGRSAVFLEPKRRGAAITAGLPSASSPTLRHFLRSFFAAQRAAPEISLFPLRSSIYCVTAVIAVAFTRSAVRYPIVQQIDDQISRVRRREAERCQRESGVRGCHTRKARGAGHSTRGRGAHHA